MKTVSNYHEHLRKILHHYLLGRVPKELMGTRAISNFIKKDQAALSKAGVDERFLDLIQDVKKSEGLEFELITSPSDSEKKNSPLEYSDLLRLSFFSRCCRENDRRDFEGRW